MRIRLLRKELIFPVNRSLFSACHASTFVQTPSGDYLVAFFAGEKEGSDDTGIWLSAFRNGRWETPRRLRYGAEPHWNPVLFTADDRIFLFYKTGATTNVWHTFVTVSEDNGLTWSKSRLLCPNDPCSRGPVRNKLLLGRDGSWIAPGSIETNVHFDSFIDKSFDGGKTWNMHPIPLTHRNGSPVSRGILWEGLQRAELWENDLAAIEKWDGVIQPALWYGEDGVLHAFLRSTRGHIYRSDSLDDGDTWCEAYATSLPSNNSGIDCEKLPDGRLVLVCNPVSGNWARRTPLSMYVSEDDGKSFSAPFPLETLEGELSYPCVCWAGGRIHVTFTFLRKSIMHCECDIVPF